MRAELLRNGLMSAVNYYKAMVENANLEEHRGKRYVSIRPF